jgi:Holliday junction resolvase RusA-like endonuclease
MDSVKFVAYGIPAAQGSKRAFVNPKTGRAIITESSSKTHASWRERVAQAAATARPQTLYDGPCNVRAVFYFLRPKSHSKRQREGIYRDSAPDLDKLLRAIGDSMTGVIYDDDRRIVSFDGCRKLYAAPGEGSRCEIEVTLLPPGGPSSDSDSYGRNR